MSIPFFDEIPTLWECLHELKTPAEWNTAITFCRSEMIEKAEYYPFYTPLPHLERGYTGMFGSLGFTITKPLLDPPLDAHGNRERPAISISPSLTANHPTVFFDQELALDMCAMLNHGRLLRGRHD